MTSPLITCSTCRRAHTAASWAALELVGHMPAESPEFPALELRNCSCESTISIELPLRRPTLVGIPAPAALSAPGPGTKAALPVGAGRYSHVRITELDPISELFRAARDKANAPRIAMTSRWA